MAYAEILCTVQKSYRTGVCVKVKQNFPPKVKACRLASEDQLKKLDTERQAFPADPGAALLCSCKMALHLHICGWSRLFMRHSWHCYSRISTCRNILIHFATFLLTLSSTRQVPTESQCFIFTKCQLLLPFGKETNLFLPLNIPIVINNLTQLFKSYN